MLHRARYHIADATHGEVRHFGSTGRYHIADATHGEVRHFGSTGAEFISV